jgi:hypothetical protein
VIRRILPLALCLALVGLLAPGPVRAADGWSVSASTDLVQADFISTSGSQAQLYMEDHVSIEPFNIPEATAVLDALGFGGGYSQEVSWGSGGGPEVSCPKGPTDLFSFCSTDTSGGWALIPDDLRTELALSASASDSRTLDVRPSLRSLAYDATVAAIGIALETLSPGPIGPNATQVASLGIQLLPEAAGFEAAMGRKDYTTAGFELLSLSKRAMTIIADHITDWAIGSIVDLIPGLEEVKLGIAVSKAIVVLANLDTHLLAGYSVTTVTVGYGGGASEATTPAPNAGTFSPTATTPAPPQGAISVDMLDQTPCDLAQPSVAGLNCDAVGWLPPDASGGSGGTISGYHLYDGQTEESCSGDAICVPVYVCPPTPTSPAQLVATVPAGTYSAYLYRAGMGNGCLTITAFNAAGESAQVPVVSSDSWQSYLADTYSVDYPGPNAAADIPTSLGGPYAFSGTGESSSYAFGSGSDRTFYAVDHLIFSGKQPGSDADSLLLFEQLLAKQDAAGNLSGATSAPAPATQSFTMENCSGMSVNTNESCPGFTFELVAGQTYERFEVVFKGDATYVVMAACPDRPANRRDAAILLMTFRPNDLFS